MKKLAFRLLYWTGVVRLVAWLNRKRVVFICYHGVTQRETRHPDDPFGLHVRQDRFRAHLQYLQKRYRVISLSDYLKATGQNQTLPDFSAVITFDDGYRNFYTAAAPLLQEHNMPAAMFLIVDRVRHNGDDALSPTRKRGGESASSPLCRTRSTIRNIAARMLCSCSSGAAAV